MDDFYNRISVNRCKHEGTCLICLEEEKERRRAKKVDAFSSTNEERIRRAEYF